jgi:ATP-dependent helicase/nuclease subunit A
LDWRYQFGDIYSLPAKNSVTQLTHHNDEYITGLWSVRALDRMPRVLMSLGQGLAGPVEPRLLGSAAHLVISQLDLSGTVTKETIEATKDKLLADNAITASLADNIDAESILSFFHSEPGKLLLNAENVVYREWPFTFTLPAYEFTDSSHESRATGDERIIVQGIIDMLIQTPNGLVVIDFKTDRITADRVPERTEFYRQQLDLYSRAASAILQTECVAKWLYFLTPRISKEV